MDSNEQSIRLEHFACNFSKQLKKNNRFLMRNLRKVCNYLKKDLLRTGSSPKSVLTDTDDDLFRGIKDTFSSPVPERLFRYMSSENAICSIQKNALHFTSAANYAEDDTKLDDLSDLYKGMFSESRRNCFMEIASDVTNINDKKRSKVANTLKDYESYFDNLRNYARVSCCTDSCRSSNHWEAYGDHWSGACLCFKPKDVPGILRKMSYEPRTEIDLCEQLAKVLHISSDGSKILDKKIPTKKEISRYSNNLKAQVVERFFTRSPIIGTDRIDLDREWRHLLFGQLAGSTNHLEDHIWGQLSGKFQYVVLGPLIDPFHRDKLLNLCREKGIPVIEMNFDCSVKSCDSDVILSEFYSYPYYKSS